MSIPSRVSPQETRRKAKSGEALLVCAYDDQEKFKEVQLDGAISLKAFDRMLPSLNKDQEIIFYCA